MKAQTIPWRCRFGWHRWPLWVSYQRIVSYFAAGVPQWGEYQRRDCPDCGKRQERPV